MKPNQFAAMKLAVAARISQFRLRPAAARNSVSRPCQASTIPKNPTVHSTRCDRISPGGTAASALKNSPDSPQTVQAATMASTPLSASDTQPVPRPARRPGGAGLQLRLHILGGIAQRRSAALQIPAHALDGVARSQSGQQHKGDESGGVGHGSSRAARPPHARRVACYADRAEMTTR